MTETTYFGYKHWTLESPPRCFYVGKGINNRPFEKRSRNHKWHSVVKRHGYKVEVCVQLSSNDDACRWEVEQIEFEKTYSENHNHDETVEVGCNFTRGGDGSIGFSHKESTKKLLSQKASGHKRGVGRRVSNETRKKISDSKSGVPNVKVKEALLGRTMSQEQRKKISEGMKKSKKHKDANESRRNLLKGRSSSNKGKKLTDEHRQKISLGLLGNSNSLGKNSNQRCSLCKERGHKKTTCEKKEK